MLKEWLPLCRVSWIHRLLCSAQNKRSYLKAIEGDDANEQWRCRCRWQWWWWCKQSLDLAIDGLTSSLSLSLTTSEYASPAKFNRSPNDVSFEYSIYLLCIWSSKDARAYTQFVINNMRLCCKSFCLLSLSNFEICCTQTHTHTHTHFGSICSVLFCVVCVCVTPELMSFVWSHHNIFGDETICYFFVRWNFAYRVRSFFQRWFFSCFLRFNVLAHPWVYPSVERLVPIVLSTNNVSITRDHIPIVSASCVQRALHNILHLMLVLIVLVTVFVNFANSLCVSVRSCICTHMSNWFVCECVLGPMGFYARTYTVETFFLIRAWVCFHKGQRKTL